MVTTSMNNNTKQYIRLSQLKPKGSNVTFGELATDCDLVEGDCNNCPHKDDCYKIFHGETPNKIGLNTWIEITPEIKPIGDNLKAIENFISMLDWYISNSNKLSPVEVIECCYDVLKEHYGYRKE